VGEVTKVRLDKRWKAFKVAEIVGLMGLMVNLCQTCDLCTPHVEQYCIKKLVHGIEVCKV
jgi:D-arabinose 1-dehydrogenase-like Zn-dependent alcohol dehydrogenase